MKIVGLLMEIMRRQFVKQISTAGSMNPHAYLNIFPLRLSPYEMSIETSTAITIKSNVLLIINKPPTKRQASQPKIIKTSLHSAALLMTRSLF